MVCQVLIFTNKKTTPRFTNVDIIADIPIKFVNHFRVQVFWDLIFQPDGITYSIKWSEYKIQFYIFWQVRKISMSCFLLWRVILPKNSKQIKTSFFFDTVPDIFRLITSLSRNILIHLSIKKSGKEFLCLIEFENSTLICKVTL